MRVNDAFFGLALLALGVFVWLHAAGFPKVPGTAYGPAFFPQVLAAGLGIAAIPRTAAAAYAGNPRFVRRPLDEPWAARELRMYALRKSPRLRAVAALIESLRG